MTFEWKGRAFVLHRELDTRKSFSKFVIRSQIHATVDRIDANATLGETPFDEEVRYPIVDIDPQMPLTLCFQKLMKKLMIMTIERAERHGSSNLGHRSLVLNHFIERGLFCKHQ